MSDTGTILELGKMRLSGWKAWALVFAVSAGQALLWIAFGAQLAHVVCAAP